MFYAKMEGRLYRGMVFGTDVVGIRKTFLRRKVESPTPNTKSYYFTSDIKEYSAEVSIYRKYLANIDHSWGVVQNIL